MNRKLLQKTSSAYLIYSVLILVISAPVFYYAISKLYITETDDTLILHKKEFLKYSLANLQQADIPAWNRFNRNIKIDSGQTLTRDSFLYTTYYDTLDAEIEPYRELVVPIFIQGKPYTYKARINLVETRDLIKNIAFLFFIIISILLIGLFIITKKLSTNLWKPFYNTLQQIESFEIDKSKPPQFNKTDVEEFSRLNTSIERLIEKNILIYKSQKEFIENAAHELQTPLAVFQAKIDTLIQRVDVSKEQSEILASLNDSVSRLNRLNKNLLLLSKMENDSYSDKQVVDLNDYIKKNLDFFTEQAAGKNLSIVTDLKEKTELLTNPVLTEVLISNLFLNAIKHNVQGGQITVSVSGNKMTFSNSGKAFPIEHKRQFTRFSKTNPSEHGTGLGLSIIKKIADLNNWKVTYDFTDNLHYFIVSF